MLNRFKRTRRQAPASPDRAALRIRNLLDDPRLQAAMAAPPSVAELASARVEQRDLLGAAA